MEAIGNPRAIKILDRQLKTGQLSHAYLFYGPEGVGKSNLALEFSQKITGDTRSGINSNIQIIKPEIIEEKGKIRKKEISIEQIRQGQHFLGLSAQNNNYRIIIIYEAELLNFQAQNALLKTLEDPSGKSIVIIVAKNDDHLLTTVLSRCQRIGFNLVKRDELIKAFRDKNKKIEEIADWSMGRPKWMKKLLENKHEIEKREKVKKEFNVILNGSNNQKLKIIEKISKDKEIIKEDIDLWITFARERLISEDEPMSNKCRAELQLIEKLMIGLQYISNTNSNPRLILESLIIN